MAFCWIGCSISYVLHLRLILIHEKLSYTRWQMLFYLHKDLNDNFALVYAYKIVTNASILLYFCFLF